MGWLDPGEHYVKERRSTVNVHIAVLLICFLLGVFCGYLWALFGYGNSDLESYLTDYFNLAAENGIDVSPVSVLWNSVKWPVFVVLLGTSVIGVAAIPIVLMIRGFLLTYTTACFSILLGRSGFIVSVVLFAVTVLLELPVLFIYGCDFLRVSIARVTRISKGEDDLKPECLLSGIGVLIVAAALQWTVVPRLFSAFCSRLFI